MASHTVFAIALRLLLVTIHAHGAEVSDFNEPPLCSSSSSAQCGNDIPDKTSLIQSRVSVNGGALRTDASKEDPQTAPGQAESGDDADYEEHPAAKFEDLVNFYADSEAQSRAAYERQELSGCIYGDNSVYGDTDNVDGSHGDRCVSQYAIAGNPFEAAGTPETTSFVYTWDQHVKLPIDQRLEHERQGDGLIGGVDLLFMEDLVSVKDTNGRHLPVGCLPMREPHDWSSLQERHFPLAVTMTAEDPVVGAKSKAIDLGSAFEAQIAEAQKILADARAATKAIKAKYSSMKDSGALKKLQADIDSQLDKLKDEYKTNKDAIKSKAGASVKGLEDKIVSKWKVWKDVTDLQKKISEEAKMEKGSVEDQMKLDIRSIKAELEQRRDDIKSASIIGQVKEAVSKESGASFTVLALPLIKKVLLPKLEGQVNFTKFLTEAKGGGASVIDDAASAVNGLENAIMNVNNQEVMESYVKGKINSVVHTEVSKALTPAYKRLWTFIRGLKNVIAAPLVQLLGAIPFVGGLLAWIITWVMDEAAEYLKSAVDGIVKKAKKVIEAEISDKIYAPIGKWIAAEIQKKLAGHTSPTAPPTAAAVKGQANAALVGLTTQLAPKIGNTEALSPDGFSTAIRGLAKSSKDDAEKAAKEEMDTDNSVSLSGRFSKKDKK